MSVMLRATAVGCAVTLCAVGCGGGGAKAAPSVVDVVVAPVQVRDVPIVVEWAAQTSGANDVEIRARVKGFLTQKAYKEGTLVRRGELLFQIDPQEYQSAVAQARATLRNFAGEIPLFNEHNVLFLTTRSRSRIG